MSCQFPNLLYQINYVCMYASLSYDVILQSNLYVCWKEFCLDYSDSDTPLINNACFCENLTKVKNENVSNDI